MRFPLLLLAGARRYPKLLALFLVTAFLMSTAAAPAVLADPATQPSTDIWPGFQILGERLIEGWSRAHWAVQIAGIAGLVACFWIWSRSRPGVNPAVLETINKTLDTINGALEEQSTQMRTLREDMTEMKKEFHSHLQTCPSAPRRRSPEAAA